MTIPESEASLVEIFASAQGEGPEVGRSTVFVRFGECDLRCRWCDSPGTWKRTEGCRIETAPGSARFEERANPVPTEVILEAVRRLAPVPMTWISLTGGEPLLQPGPLRALLPALQAEGRRTYLETHGLHTDILESVIDHVDLVSMDWKLASDVSWGPGLGRDAPKDFHAAHERFLRLACRRSAVYVKAVITPESRDDEIDEMLDRIISVDSGIPLVLQPVTPNAGCKTSPSGDRMLELLARAESILSDVRVIPQTHPFYGVL